LVSDAVFGHVRRLYFDNRNLEMQFALATQAAVTAQVDAGVDIPTDGEMRREHYIFYHLRHLSGVDFEHLQLREIRTRAWEREVPTIIDRIHPKDRFLPYDYTIVQSYSSQPIKITVPGPMTIADTVADEHYDDPRELNRDLADALNVQIRVLVPAGCNHIQVDEPVFARKTDEALPSGSRTSSTYNRPGVSNARSIGVVRFSAATSDEPSG
jgi:5-methyltetrahydropteroyltriglutamate--homocysteine methyltransferase